MHPHRFDVSVIGGDWSPSSSKLITHRAISQSVDQYVAASGRLFSHCDKEYEARFCLGPKSVARDVTELLIRAVSSKMTKRALSLRFEVRYSSLITYIFPSSVF